MVGLAVVVVLDPARPIPNAPLGMVAPNRFTGIMLPGNGEAQPDTPEGNPITLVKPPIIVIPLKPNGVEIGDPSKFPDCASEIIGASLMASLNMFNFAF